MERLFIKRKKRKFIGKSGDRFGRLTLTGLTYTKTIYGHWVRFVEAVCDCGEVKEYPFYRIANGETQSCGCFRKVATGKRMRTHGLTKHPLFDVWQQMKARCYNPNNEQFKDYGGRGIEVWLDWKEDFLEFYEWCLANGYKDDLSLDRIDNDGFYSPQNCRFATREEQNRNTRRNKMITAFGETKCLFDWGKDKRCAIGVWGLRSRYDIGEWTDMEKMITSPATSNFVRSRNTKRSKMFTAFGETKCQSEWLEDTRCLVKIDSFRDRLKKGWDVEKVITTPPSRDGKN